MDDYALLDLVRCDSVRPIIMESAHKLRERVVRLAKIAEGYRPAFDGVELMHWFVQHDPWFPEIYVSPQRMEGYVANAWDEYTRNPKNEAWVIIAYRGMQFADRGKWHQGYEKLEKVLRLLHGRDYERFLDDPAQAVQVFLDKKNMLALYAASVGSVVDKFTRADGDTAIMRRVVDWF